MEAPQLSGRAKFFVGLRERDRFRWMHRRSVAALDSLLVRAILQENRCPLFVMYFARMKCLFYRRNRRCIQPDRSRTPKPATETRSPRPQIIRCIGRRPAPGRHQNGSTQWHWRPPCSYRSARLPETPVGGLQALRLKSLITSLPKTTKPSRSLENNSVKAMETAARRNQCRAPA